MTKFVFCYPVSKIFFSKKQIWLISERGFDARDNGYVLYKYIITNHKDINAFYIISKESPDFYKIKQLRNYVIYGSLKHYCLYIAAKVRMSTHVYSFAPGNYIGEYFKLKNHHKKIDVFLQHGISHHKISFLEKNNNNCDLFICGAKPEFEYINNCCGYPEGVAKYTGFPRFDNYHPFYKKKQILIMPTWRQYLNSCSLNDFLKTDYFIKWNGLLNSQSLEMLSKEYNFNIVFYPHVSMLEYSHLFKSNFIKIVSFNNQDIQDLLKESSILITDYSSVSFDFAYMRKNIIYFQFDKQEFYEKHYKKSYFIYERDGFGPVCENEFDVIKALEDSLKSDCKVPSNIQMKINNFFPLYDSNNCERVFQAIKAKL